MKKRLFSLFLTILILCCCTYIACAKPEINMLRVGLCYSNDAVDKCSISSESGFLVGTESDRKFNQTGEIESGTIEISIAADGICSFSDKTFDTKNGTLTFMPKNNEFISFKNNKYRGGIQIINAGNGKMNIVNLISPDDYIKGVIGSEMPSSWHIEALKAQAVCARNYAISNVNKHSKYGFDVCTTVDCQVYGGVNAETKTTIQASEETSGKYLLYNGALAETLFFSCDGGHTSNSKYVWGSDIPYLRGVKDIYENPSEASRYNWSTTLTADELEAKLATSGVNIGKITAITATTEPTTGQVYNLEIKGTSGTHVLKNDKTRTWLGYNTLYSQVYTITPVTAGSTSTITALSAKGKSSPQGLSVLSSEGITSISYPFIAKSSKSINELNAMALAYRFDGHGWGHGLGMSQYGAKAMADQGFTYDEILTFYYQGTYLE